MTIFNGAPAEVPLATNPLVKVIVQLKFPMNALISTNEGVAPFQSALRPRYPLMKKADQLSFLVGPNSISNSPTSVWRISDLQETWFVVLGSDFIALETGAYESRSDFMDRWLEVLSALATADLVPTRCDRIGVRYINRVERGEFLDGMENYLNQEFIGVGRLGFSEEVEVVASVSQVHYRMEEYEVRAVWGTIPSNVALLPGIEPVSHKSWMLDVDVFTELGMPFEVSEISLRTRQFSEQSHAFFRWATNDKFLRLYGGRI